MADLPKVSRRSVLGGALATGVLAAAPSAGAAPATIPRRGRQQTMIGTPFEEHETVRVGLIGLGNRGMGMLSGWAAVPGCAVTAVCDIRADRATRAANRVV